MLSLFEVDSSDNATNHLWCDTSPDPENEWKYCLSDNVDVERWSSECECEVKWSWSDESQATEDVQVEIDAAKNDGRFDNLIDVWFIDRLWRKLKFSLSAPTHEAISVIHWVCPLTTPRSFESSCNTMLDQPRSEVGQLFWNVMPLNSTWSMLARNKRGLRSGYLLLGFWEALSEIWSLWCIENICPTSDH